MCTAHVEGNTFQQEAAVESTWSVQACLLLEAKGSSLRYACETVADSKAMWVETSAWEGTCVVAAVLDAVVAIVHDSHDRPAVLRQARTEALRGSYGWP